MSHQVDERTTAPFHTEHRHLLALADRLATAGDAVGVAPAGVLREAVDAAHAFLATHLLPHASAEDAVLYTEVDRLLGERGGTRATDTMRRDHVEVARLADRLGELRERLHAGAPADADERELRRVLYGLYAIVSLHFAKEEEVYLPLLGRELTAAEAQTLFERMEDAGREAGAARAH
jgi:iron-sulfur cluster repair protein YtfE (RIC family)